MKNMTIDKIEKSAPIGGGFMVHAVRFHTADSFGLTLLVENPTGKLERWEDCKGATRAMLNALPRINLFR